MSQHQISPQQLVQQSQQSQPETNDLDDFMDSIGLDVKPLGPEHAFMIFLEQEGYNKLHLYRWWIRHEIFGWFDLVENGMPPCKRILDRNNGDMVYTPATRTEYVLIRTKYHLRQHYQPWFDPKWKPGYGMRGLGVTDIDKTAQTLIDHPHIKPLLTAKKDDMPRNI